MLERITACMLLVILVASCSPSTGIEDPRGPEEDTLSLPFPFDRQTAAPFSTELSGSSFTTSTGPPRVTTFNETAILQSNGFINAWAIWQFNQPGDPILEIATHLRIDEGNSGFIGIADYDTGRWEFIPATDGTQVVSIDQARHVSPAGNVFISVVAVRSDKVLADGFSVTIDKSGWHVLPVVTEGQVGLGCVIREVNGRPAIACRRFVPSAENELVYAYSLTELGLYPEDWFSITVDAANGIANCDLAVINGKPAIAYQRGTELVYSGSSTVSGHGPANWGVKVVVDSGSNVGEQMSLGTADGRPAIVYRVGLPDTELRYAVSSTLKGDTAGAWDSMAIDSGGNAGSYPHLASVEGNPAATYYDSLNNRVAYIRSTTQRGDGPIDWIQYSAVANEGAVNNYFNSIALIVADGNPAVAFLDSQQDELLWFRSTSSDGANTEDWTQEMLVDQDINIRFYGGIAIVDGNPALCYKDNDNDRIHFTRSTNASGTGLEQVWDRTDVFESPDGSVLSDIRMSTVAGRPVICFYHGGPADTHRDLYYAVLLD